MCLVRKAKLIHFGGITSCKQKYKYLLQTGHLNDQEGNRGYNEEIFCQDANCTEQAQWCVMAHFWY
jgi:hypothetical protein